MELVTSVSQLSAGSRIAVLGNTDFDRRTNQFGIIASIDDRIVSYVDQGHPSYLTDMGVVAYDSTGRFNPTYKTYLVSEDETEALKAEYASFCQERTASAMQAARLFNEKVTRGMRNKEHRDALTDNGTVPLSGAASLILGS